MKVFEWDKIETNKTSGTTKCKCPECTPTRKNKTDRSLYVNFTSGIAKCFNCDAISFRESLKNSFSNDYKLPSQDWKNYTKLSDGLIKYFEGRKISQSTILKLNISEEAYYQPALSKEVNNVVFNYFEGDLLVNKKYRSGDKKFTQTKSGKPIFYNINSIIGQEECYIVEGEMDALSLVEIGINNVVSVPNGANDNDAYWINSERYLKEVKRFFIAVDNDLKGNELAEKIAQRLGRWRCERVLFEGKDANEDLVSGVLNVTVHRKRKYPISGTFTVESMYDNILELYDNGFPKTIFPKHKCFGELKNAFSVMRGHLVTVVGIPSHGKSNMLEWYVLNLIKDYNMKVSFFSPEHSPMELHQSLLIQKVFGKNFYKDFGDTKRVSKEEIEKYKDWANEKIYLTATDEGAVANWDWLLDKFKEQLYNYGIDIFVVDAFNKVELQGNETLREINKALTRLTSFAQANNVIIFLVVHPTKMKKGQNGLYEMPSLYDASGSADFRNQTHDGFCVYRYFGNESQPDRTVFVNLKTKFSFQGEISKQVEFSYHVPSGRYYASGSEAPSHSLIDDYLAETIDSAPEVEEEVDIEDIPF